MTDDYDKLLTSWDECRAKLIAAEEDVFRLRHALGNCYMMAKRELHRLDRASLKGLAGKTYNSLAVEQWQHVLRFCEEAGCKSDILRATLPTEITDGGKP